MADQIRVVNCSDIVNISTSAPEEIIDKTTTQVEFVVNFVEDTVSPIFVNETVSVETRQDDIMVSRAEQVIGVEQLVQNVVVSLPAEESIDIHQINEFYSYGQIPYSCAPVINNTVELDILKSQAFVVNCRNLKPLTTLTIEVVNWPRNTLTDVFVLLSDVAPAIFVLWPGFERGVWAPANKNVNNEYLLRSWDGGKTLYVSRTATYPVRR